MPTWNVRSQKKKKTQGDQWGGFGVAEASAAGAGRRSTGCTSPAEAPAAGPEWVPGGGLLGLKICHIARSSVEVAIPGDAGHRILVGEAGHYF